MSYDLTGYKLQKDDSPQVLYQTMMHGEDEYEAADLTEEEERSVQEILIRFGFQKTGYSSPQYERNSISAGMYGGQISFTLPYWEDTKDDFDLVMRVATTIFKEVGLFFWDQQESAVITDVVISGDQFEKMVQVVKEIPQRMHRPRPWWRFW